MKDCSSSVITTPTLKRASPSACQHRLSRLAPVSRWNCQQMCITCYPIMHQINLQLEASVFQPMKHKCGCGCGCGCEFGFECRCECSNSAIFEKVGYRCGRIHLLKNYYLYFLYIAKHTFSYNCKHIPN